MPLWSTALECLSNIVLHADVHAFINHPASTAAQQAELVMALFSKISGSNDKATVEHLVSLLAENHRLSVLPDVYVQYEALRAQQEKTLVAFVTSFSELSKAQQQQLIHVLSQRLQREITLELSIDKSLLGGAVVCAGDLVIDGSVRGKLTKLGTYLAA